MASVVDISHAKARREALQGGGGGGTLDPMEARVAALETIANDTRSSLESINRQLARMDTKLDAKPDQGWIINLVCIIFGLVLATVAATGAIFALIK
jgi:tetrahydromethanopterin S-methyltransferase subunit B